MKLLTPTEIKQTKETELAKDLLRTQAVKSALDKAKTELDNTDAKFNAMLAKQRVIWAKEQEGAVEKITSLQSEIKTLEKHKEQLLIPIELDQQKAHDMLEEARIILEKVKVKEAYNDELESLLTERLDKVSDKLADVQNLMQQQLAKQVALAEQESMYKKLSRELTKKWEEYYLTINKK